MSIPVGGHFHFYQLIPISTVTVRLKGLSLTEKCPPYPPPPHWLSCIQNKDLLFHLSEIQNLGHSRGVDVLKNRFSWDGKILIISYFSQNLGDFIGI